MTQTKSGPARAIGYVRVSTKDQGENGFGLEADGRPPHPDTIRQRFDRLAAAAGLSRITFHDLRHSYATGALNRRLTTPPVQRNGDPTARRLSMRSNDTRTKS